MLLAGNGARNRAWLAQPATGIDRTKAGTHRSQSPAPDAAAPDAKHTRPDTKHTAPEPPARDGAQKCFCRPDTAGRLVSYPWWMLEASAPGPRVGHMDPANNTKNNKGRKSRACGGVNPQYATESQ